MIRFTSKGDWKTTEDFLKRVTKNGPVSISSLDKFGRMGVEALRAGTPVRTGTTANSWSYEIEQGHDSITIIWSNSHVERGYANIAVLLQYGHATRNGGYVVGRDYINPAMRPLFDQIAEDAWKEVTVSK